MPWKLTNKSDKQLADKSLLACARSALEAAHSLPPELSSLPTIPKMMQGRLFVHPLEWSA